MFSEGQWCHLPAGVSSYLLCSLFGSVLAVPLNSFIIFLRPFSWGADVTASRPCFEAAETRPVHVILNLPGDILYISLHLHKLLFNLHPRGAIFSVNGVLIFSTSLETEMPPFLFRGGLSCLLGAWVLLRDVMAEKETVARVPQLANVVEGEIAL